MKKSKKFAKEIASYVKHNISKDYSKPRILQECIFETRALACANVPTNEDCAGSPKYS